MATETKLDDIKLEPTQFQLLPNNKAIWRKPGSSPDKPNKPATKIAVEVMVKKYAQAELEKVTTMISWFKSVDIPSGDTVALLEDGSSGNIKNLAKYYGYYQDKSEIVTVTESAGNGTLADALNAADKQFTGVQLYKIALGIVNGLLFLHKRDRIHENLSATNVLLAKDFTPKLANFAAKYQVGTPKQDIKALGNIFSEIIKKVNVNGQVIPADHPFAQLAENLEKNIIDSMKDVVNFLEANKEAIENIAPAATAVAPAPAQPPARPRAQTVTPQKKSLVQIDAKTTQVNQAMVPASAVIIIDASKEAQTLQQASLNIAFFDVCPDFFDHNATVTDEEKNTYTVVRAVNFEDVDSYTDIEVKKEQREKAVSYSGRVVLMRENTDIYDYQYLIAHTRKQEKLFGGDLENGLNRLLKNKPLLENATRELTNGYHQQRKQDALDKLKNNGVTVVIFPTLPDGAEIHENFLSYVSAKLGDKFSCVKVDDVGLSEEDENLSLATITAKLKEKYQTAVAPLVNIKLSLQLVHHTFTPPRATVPTPPATPVKKTQENETFFAVMDRPRTLTTSGTKNKTHTCEEKDVELMDGGSETVSPEVISFFETDVRLKAFYIFDSTKTDAFPDKNTKGLTVHWLNLTPSFFETRTSGKIRVVDPHKNIHLPFAITNFVESTSLSDADFCAQLVSATALLSDPDEITKKKNEELAHIMPTILRLVGLMRQKADFVAPALITFGQAYARFIKKYQDFLATYTPIDVKTRLMTQGAVILFDSKQIDAANAELEPIRKHLPAGFTFAEIDLSTQQIQKFFNLDLALTTAITQAKKPAAAAPTPATPEKEKEKAKPAAGAEKKPQTVFQQNLAFWQSQTPPNSDKKPKPAAKPSAEKEKKRDEAATSSSTSATPAKPLASQRAANYNLTVVSNGDPKKGQKLVATTKSESTKPKSQQKPDVVESAEQPFGLKIL